uniref:S2 protein n=1 Tax=Equine infectious anemia virus TaxID=11665 RepID=K4PBI9_9RETR|nr:S2 protein [Equine infectious anemia virus]
MGVLGKQVTWSVLPSMGASQEEYLPLLVQNQNRQIQTRGVLWCFNPIVIMAAIKEGWQKKGSKYPQKNEKSCSKEKN